MRSVIAIALLLTACGEAPELAQARQAVAAAFPYPTSAEFRNVRPGNSAGVVCGEVRGRQSDGQMTDYRRFSWREGSVVIEGFAPTDRLARAQDTIVNVGCA